MVPQFRHTLTVFLNPGVTSLTTCDINEDGVNEVVVGRSDGFVNVYAFDEGQSAPVETMSLVSCTLVTVA